MKKEVIRRSITIPTTLDNKISVMADEYNYKIKNDLIIELLELGIIKHDEDMEIKSLLLELINKVEILINQSSK